MDDADRESNRPSLKHYWPLAKRRRWWALGPLFLFGWLGFGLAHIWPYLYRSQALILVEQQKVPEQYVTPNVVSDLQGRLQSMTQQILSRTRLQEIIEQLNLYPRERARMVMEDVVAKMREDIQIEPEQTRGRTGELTAFRISYAAKSPRVAQQVTSQLTELFIEKNLQARTQASEGTTTFLESQLEQARKNLADQEETQRQYKLRYLGQLPEQEQSNLQILSSLEAELHATSDSLDRAEQQQVYLESMRDEYQATKQSLGAGPSSGPLAVASSTLADLRKQLADLETRYTPEYPDIVRIKAKIAQWEGVEQSLRTSPAAGRKTGTGPDADTSGGDAALIEIGSRLKSVTLEVVERQKEIEQLKGRIRDMQSRLNLTPVREQQLAEVTRAYENSREYYQSLLQKKLQSELATNLERHQEGEQFRILDPASLPEKPDEPSPEEIILFGWLAGLCGGVLLATLREVNDDTLRDRGDIAASTKVPLLVRIPVLRTDREQRRRRWRGVLEAAGVVLLLLISVTTTLHTLVVR
jgi:protein tyrosine kinase modulator